MAQEQARVIAADAQSVTLRMLSQKGCQSCEMSSGCGTASLGRLLGFRGFDIKLANDLGLKVDDRVVLSIKDDALLNASLLVYLLPLFAMLLCALLADALGLTEFWVAAGAAAGLLGGIGFAGRIARFSFGKALQPKMSRQIY